MLFFVGVFISFKMVTCSILTWEHMPYCFGNGLNPATTQPEVVFPLPSLEVPTVVGEIVNQ